MPKFIRFSAVLCVTLVAYSGCGGAEAGPTTFHRGAPRNAEVRLGIEAGGNEQTKEATGKNIEISAQTRILTIGSSPVYWPEFHFWLDYIVKFYKNSHGYSEITNWSATQNGMSLSHFFLSTAVGYACKDRAIETKAKALGVKLSQEDLEKIRTARENNIKIYGKTEYRHIVESMYVSEDVHNYLTRMDNLGNRLFERLYGAKGEKCSGACVSAYAKKEGYMAVKYIFRSNTDADGKARSAAKRKANYELLKGILARLRASDAPLPLFGALMNKYGEDPSLSDYPSGRLLVSGRKGTAFEKAYLKLRDYQYSGIVKADDGDYIILRMPIVPDMVVDTAGNTLRYWAAYQYLFENQVSDWCRKTKISYDDAYYRIDVETLLR